MASGAPVTHAYCLAVELEQRPGVDAWNHTIRKREKIMRGIKRDDTPISPINRIYYNFIRPHMGLDGATPAEAAGIGISGENKWMSILRQTANKKDENQYA
jgi:hypothetical protein